MAGYKRMMLRNTTGDFLKLYVAEEYNGKKNYSMACRIEKDSDNHKNLLAAIKTVVEERYPGKADAMIKRFQGSKTTWPIREMEDGSLRITPKRKEQNGAPLVVDGRRNIIPADSGQVYGGCVFNVSIDVSCYTQNGGGVTTYLNGCQLVKQGTPTTGSVAASCRDDFDDLGDQGQDESNDDLF